MVAVENKYQIQSVMRATVLLNAFLEPPHRFGVTELSRATKLTKNQTFRLLQTFLSANYVVQDPQTKTYSLGYRLVELGAAAQRGSTLTQAAAPVLDALAEQTGETVHLVKRADERSAICLDKRDSRWALQISARVGGRFPLHVGSTPKLLLAYAPEDVIDSYLNGDTPLTRFTPKTRTEPDDLRAELERIREQGFAQSEEELDPGVCSIAAPVRGRCGEVIAAVSVAAPITRVGLIERRRITEAVLAGAGEISRRL